MRDAVSLALATMRAMGLDLAEIRREGELLLPRQRLIRKDDDVMGEKGLDHRILRLRRQRLRQIHQLQTAWFVFPTAEHTRFQHVLGVMHLINLRIFTNMRTAAKHPADAHKRWDGIPELQRADATYRR